MNDDGDDDSKLFREAVQNVKPLRSGQAPPERRPAPVLRPLQHEADERAALQEMADGPIRDTGDELSYRTDGIQDSVFRKLKRGGYHTGDELDLHGMRTAAAKIAVVQFLARCQERDTRCARIIHGKGLRSKGDGPVLKQRLDGWLRQRRDVLAFCSARAQDGGTGAVYVLLRKAPATGY